MQSVSSTDEHLTLNKDITINWEFIKETTLEMPALHTSENLPTIIHGNVIVQASIHIF